MYERSRVKAIVSSLKGNTTFLFFILFTRVKFYVRTHARKKYAKTEIHPKTWMP